ncbi:MAG: ribonuclease PH [Bacillota bacterium]
MRSDGRRPDQMRPVRITREYLRYPEGSCLAEFGDTKVICTASIEDKVPQFVKSTGHGWLTAEYSMLPRATPVRNTRESTKGRPGGRTLEIQRLIGRSLRSVLDLGALGERTIWVDCDVIQADGGTRTASITGAFVALVLALDRLAGEGKIQGIPVSDFVAATSAGVVRDAFLLDLCFSEDANARVDMNIVMTGLGQIVEIQGTGEQAPFTQGEMETLLRLAYRGISELVTVQRNVLGSLAGGIGVKPGI